MHSARRAPVYLICGVWSIESQREFLVSVLRLRGVVLYPTPGRIIRISAGYLGPEEPISASFPCSLTEVPGGAPVEVTPKDRSRNGANRAFIGFLNLFALVTANLLAPFAPFKDIGFRCTTRIRFAFVERRTLIVG